MLWPTVWRKNDGNSCSPHVIPWPNNCALDFVLTRGLHGDLWRDYRNFRIVCESVFDHIWVLQVDEGKGGCSVVKVGVSLYKEIPFPHTGIQGFLSCCCENLTTTNRKNMLIGPCALGRVGDVSPAGDNTSDLKMLWTDRFTISAKPKCILKWANF